MNQNNLLTDPSSAGIGEQKRGSQPRKHLFAISVIMVVGLVVRLIAIADRGIWYDDAFSIFLARQNLTGIVTGTAVDTMPPLYYFLLHFWMMAGESIVWLRLLNVIISLAVILLVYVWAMKMFGPRVGFWAALLTAVSPIQIYHAQEIRMYALLELTQLGYILFFFNSIAHEENKFKNRWGSWGHWIGLIVCGSGAMYTHNLAIFVLVVPNLILLAQRRWQPFFKLLAAQTVIVIVTIPWLVLVPGQIEKIQRAFWTPKPGLVEILQAIIVFTAAQPLSGVWQVIAVLLSVEAFVLMTLEMGRLMFRRNIPTSENGNGLWSITGGRNRQIMATVFFALAPPILMFIVSYVMRPVFVPRGFLFSSLAYYVLIAWMVGGRTNQVGGRLVMGAVLIAVLISLPFQYTYNQFPRSPFREAAHWLDKNMRPDSIVIHDNKLSYFPSKFYAQGLEQVFLGDEPGSHNDTFAPATQAAMGIFPEDNMQSAAANKEQVYFVVFDKTIQDYRTVGLPDHPHLEWLDSCYDLVDQVSFEDLTVYHYAWLETCQVED